MQNVMKIMGIDPSLRNFGLALAHVDLDTMNVDVSVIKLVETEKGKLKNVRKSSDDLSRARLLHRALKTWQGVADMAVAEVPTGTQSASGAISNGICIGILASIEIPLIEVSPTEVKMATVGIKTATKSEMIEWAMKKHPKAQWLTRKLKGETVPMNDCEHLADAIAAIYAGLQTEQFKQARAFTLKRAA
jgi:Holliday junction resolvasome RuvABC endonuclease subunit